MDIKVLSLQEDPTLKTNEIMNSVWPKFMSQDNYSMKYWASMRRLYPEYQLCLCNNDRLVAYGNSIPIKWSGIVEELPMSWTDTLVQGVENKDIDDVNTLVAVNIAIHSEYQKLGLSQRLLNELKELAVKVGFKNFIVPVRPSFKAEYPITLFDQYIHWKREDGAPFDPWIRTHWKLGAKIIKPIHNAMTVKGTIKEWENWTNMKFPDSGKYVIKGALQPIEIDRDRDCGVYNDPNVWMQYNLN
ncbi:GNAT family N-acetyltransferase [Paenibacillus kobensis]|uniref:GNAT family N-acetyltransferase n=1 Tax=Paenibacillus kobensis TaxID=59841 RepID=UPI000FD6B968|nr:GNAT family N-acetyltransferase [Paenibacillus kobensis]